MSNIDHMPGRAAAQPPRSGPGKACGEIIRNSKSVRGTVVRNVEQNVTGADL
jgi:hypothetical protein